MIQKGFPQKIDGWTYTVHVLFHRRYLGLSLVEETASRKKRDLNLSIIGNIDHDSTVNELQVA
jgi:hypothetical protein